MFDGIRLALRTARLEQAVKRINNVPTLIKIGKKINEEARKSSDTAHGILDRKSIPMTKREKQKIGATMAKLDMELKQLEIVIARIRELQAK